MKPPQITPEEMRVFVASLSKDVPSLGLVDRQAYQRIGQLEEMLRCALNSPDVFAPIARERILEANQKAEMNGVDAARIFAEVAGTV